MQIEHSSHFVKARQPRQVVVYLIQNLRSRGRALPIIFARIDRSVNVLQLLSLTVFTQRNFVALFLSEVRFYTVNGRLGVLSPRSGGRGLRNIVRWSS